MKASQEEIDKTKRFMYINENLKRQKIIQKSVISGRRNTTGPKLPAAGLNRRVGIGGLTNFDLAALNITE